MTNTSDQNLKLAYREDLNILFFRWSSHSPTLSFTASYLKALELAEQKQARYWLIDLRLRGDSTEQDRLWLLNTFFPKVKNNLGTCYFAYLVSPSHQNLIDTRIGNNGLQKFYDLVPVRIFTGEQTAIDWLSQLQPKATL